MSKSVLYFARGRGRGHALAALAIAEHLEAEMRYVSYGTGAATFRELGHAVLDLNLPDQPGLFGVESKLPRAFEGPKPALVVAHEEFDVCLAARHRGLPCVFVTDWFIEPESWQMAALKHVEEILFLDAEGAFAPPEVVAGKVQYIGPVLRPLRYRRADRRQARQEAGLPLDALIVSVFIHPGRRTEEVAPLAGVLEEAFDQLDGPKLLLWGRDGDEEYDRIMAASDLAITKGNRNLVLELASLGVPTISVSHGLNTIDDLRTAQLAGNRTMPYAGLEAGQLLRLMLETIAVGSLPLHFDDGAGGAAKFLANRLDER